MCAKWDADHPCHPQAFGAEQTGGAPPVHLSPPSKLHFHSSLGWHQSSSLEQSSARRRVAWTMLQNQPILCKDPDQLIRCRHSFSSLYTGRPLRPLTKITQSPGKKKQEASGERDREATWFAACMRAYHVNACKPLSPHQVPTYSNALLIPEMGLPEEKEKALRRLDNTTPRNNHNHMTDDIDRRMSPGTIKRNTPPHHPKDKERRTRTLPLPRTPPPPGRAGPVPPLRSQNGTTTTTTLKIEVGVRQIGFTLLVLVGRSDRRAACHTSPKLD